MARKVTDEVTARPLWKEVPRFPTYRRAGIALWHECADLDIAISDPRLKSQLSGVAGPPQPTKGLAPAYPSRGFSFLRERGQLSQRDRQEPYGSIFVTGRCEEGVSGRCEGRR